MFQEKQGLLVSRTAQRNKNFLFDKSHNFLFICFNGSFLKNRSNKGLFQRSRRKTRNKNQKFCFIKESQNSHNSHNSHNRIVYLFQWFVSEQKNTSSWTNHKNRSKKGLFPKEVEEKHETRIKTREEHFLCQEKEETKTNK